MAMMKLDINGRVIELSREHVELLRDAAAARAASSSRLRDLSLMLDRALRSGHVLALRRSEARVLTELLAPQSTHELRELRQEILDRFANER
jgi:hypothetical protein